MTQVYIAGVGMTPFGRHLDESIHDLSSAAAALALQDAGAEASAI